MKGSHFFPWNHYVGVGLNKWLSYRVVKDSCCNHSLQKCGSSVLIVSYHCLSIISGYNEWYFLWKFICCEFSLGEPETGDKKDWGQAGDAGGGRATINRWEKFCRTRCDNLNDYFVVVVVVVCCTLFRRNIPEFRKETNLLTVKDSNFIQAETTILAVLCACGMHPSCCLQEKKWNKPLSAYLFM